jgi:N-acetylglucosamine-6-sulfatase
MDELARREPRQGRARHLGSLTAAPGLLARRVRTRAARLAHSLRTPSRRRQLRLRAAVVLAAAFAMLGPLFMTDADDVHAAPTHAATGARHQPNIVVILTDDQRTDSLLSMPSVRSLLVDRGTRYTHAYIPTSICCPSRSAILTGLYSHDNGVWENGGRHGGWLTFRRLGNEQRTIAVALQHSGYRTGLIGKYLNNFGRLAPPDYKPPGWNRFEGFRLPEKSGAYYDYRLGQRGGSYGAASQDYSTDVLATRAVNFIWSTPEQRSLFLYFAPFAPHYPYAPAPRDLGQLQGKLPPYRPASITAPVDDKPAWVRRLPEVTPGRIDLMRERQGESLMAVDDAVAAIVAALEHSGRLRDTMIVFMSDNGLQTGEHHIVGKSTPYNASTSVPLVIRWDGRVAAGTVDPRIALNVDLAKTIATVAKTPMTTDGMSILGKRTRSGFVLEAGDNRRYGRPAYCGWRTKQWMYVHYASGEEELYNYAADPDELSNLAGNPGYAGQLSAMKANAKQACRPMPPGFTWS